jgi:hypothetical protein
VFGSENDVRGRNPLEARPKMGAENEGNRYSYSEQGNNPTHSYKGIYIYYFLVCVFLE